MEQTQDLPSATTRPAFLSHLFGGFRESGSRFKEQGARRLRSYTRVKTPAVRFAW